MTSLGVGLGFIHVLIFQEMTSLGVGLGSVHANHHPRVTTHCGVNQVPTVVGVVSGRVIHFHGNLRGVDTMQDFLNNILPQNVVPLVSLCTLCSCIKSKIL
jgi:thioredoxin-like negative regulator of GroEL